MLMLARDADVPIVLQHSRGTPKTMKSLTEYGGDEHVIDQVARELQKSIDRALSLGVKPWMIITDPGLGTNGELPYLVYLTLLLGFAKTPEQSLSILRTLSRWHSLIGAYPLYIGPSRKGFIGHV